jgi:hypothetical protein
VRVLLLLLLLLYCFCYYWLKKYIFLGTCSVNLIEVLKVMLDTKSM